MGALGPDARIANIANIANIIDCHDCRFAKVDAIANNLTERSTADG